MSERNLKNRLAALILVCTLLQIPFLGQAFHIDDNIYLMIAANLGSNPLFPSDLNTYFEGLKVESFISHEHPLFLPSLLLYPAVVSPSPELVAHSIFLIFFLLLIVSTFLLARPLTNYPWVAAVLAALSPVVFVSSHSVMLDLPFTALIYTALALVIHRPASIPRNWLAGLSCTGAVMLAYQALFFVPVVFWGARNGQRRSYHLIWSLPVAALVLYCLANSIHFGRFIWWDLFLFWQLQPSSGGGMAGKLAHSALALLGAVIFPFAWALLFKRPRFRRPVAQEGLSTAQILIWVFAVNILVVLFVYHIGAVRYWLPSVPALCIFITWSIEQRTTAKTRAVALSGVVLLTALTSIPLAWADYEWTDFYRETSHVAREYRHRSTVWITGEWGFRWYFTREGAKVLGRADSRPKGGDLLIRPRIASPYRTIYDEEDALELERTIEYHPSLPVRLLDFQSGAGFYSSGWGLLPYSLTFVDEPLELIAIYRIKKSLPSRDREPTYWEWHR